MNSLRTLTFKRYSAIGFYILILLGSSIPGTKIPEIFQLTPDKLIHCLEYMGFGFFTVRWLSAQFVKAPLNKVFGATLLLGACCALLDELYQHLVPNRSPDFYDWCLDVIGVGLSIPLYQLVRKAIGD